MCFKIFQASMQIYLITTGTVVNALKGVNPSASLCSSNLLESSISIPIRELQVIRRESTHFATLTKDDARTRRKKILHKKISWLI